MRGRKYSPRSTKTNDLHTSFAQERIKSFSVERPTTQGFKIRKYCNVPSRTDHKNIEYIKASIKFCIRNGHNSVILEQDLKCKVKGTT